jgi:hypothetical protein
VGALACAALSAAAIAGLSGSFVVPLEHEAIQYATRPVSDHVARLQTRLASGEAKLMHDEQTGYLRSILRELNIPLESQVLVFSKTSFRRIWNAAIHACSATQAEEHWEFPGW